MFAYRDLWFESEPGARGREPGEGSRRRPRLLVLIVGGIDCGIEGPRSEVAARVRNVCAKCAFPDLGIEARPDLQPLVVCARAVPIGAAVLGGDAGREELIRGRGRDRTDPRIERAYGDTRLEGIHLPPGHDLDHPTDAIRAIECGRRSAHDLDPLDLGEGDR